MTNTGFTKDKEIDLITYQKSSYLELLPNGDLLDILRTKLNVEKYVEAVNQVFLMTVASLIAHLNEEDTQTLNTYLDLTHRSIDTYTADEIINALNQVMQTERREMYQLVLMQGFHNACETMFNAYSLK